MSILLFIIALALLPYALLVGAYILATIIAVIVLFFKVITFIYRFTVKRI